NEDYGYGVYLAENPAVAEFYRNEVAGAEGGNIYRVHIDAEPNEFLDWDRPIADQDEGALAKLREALPDDQSTTVPQLMERYQPGWLANRLSSGGIPGVRYLDQRSRAAGSGTSNYVVFDPGLLTIAGGEGVVAGPKSQDAAEQAQDAEHWITVHPHGEEHDGSPVLINGAGQVIGGVGGKLTGKVFHPSSKSEARPGTTKQHAPAIWLGAGPEKPKLLTGPKPKEEPPSPPARGPNPHPPGSKENYVWEKAKKEALSREADKLSETAKTVEEHREAMAAHLAAYNSWKPWGVSRRDTVSHHATEYHRHRKEIARLERAANKAQKPKTTQKPKASSENAVFAKGTPDEINKHLMNKWGLGFSNGVKQGRAREALRKWLSNPDRESEEGKKLHEEYVKLTEMERGDPSAGLRNHTQIDITQSSASANGMRNIISKVDEALEKLDSSGFDVKKALAKASVSLVAGSTGKHLGHAWGGVNGYFSISPTKRGQFDSDQAARNEGRVKAGQARWTVS